MRRRIKHKNSGAFLIKQEKAPLFCRNTARLKQGASPLPGKPRRAPVPCPSAPSGAAAHASILGFLTIFTFKTSYSETSSLLMETV